MATEKECKNCGEVKPLEEFPKEKKGVHGRRSICLICNRKRQKAYRIANKERLYEKTRKWYSENKEYMREYRQRRLEEHGDELRARAREQYEPKRREKKKAYRAANKERIRKKNKEYRHRNKERIRAYAKSVQPKINARNRIKRATDPYWKLQKNLRDRMTEAVRQNNKAGSAVRDLGCSIASLKEYLEGQFYADENGVMMTWDNWGKVWQIDHIFPLAAANLEDRIEVLAVCNWRNLQPLTRHENASKHDTVYPDALKLFKRLVAQFESEQMGDAA